MPVELYDLGQEFKKRFKLNYEVVYSHRFHEAIEYGPIQIGVSNWLRRGNYYVSNGNIIHATMLWGEEPWKVFDTYPPFVKQLEERYNFMSYGYQWHITEITTNSLIKKLMDFCIRLKNGAIFWGKGGTNKIQKVTKENAGLVAVTHLMRKKGEKIINIPYVNDEAFKQYQLTEEFFGVSKSNFLKRLFN